VIFFGNSLYIKPNNISLIDTEFSIDIIIKLLPALLSLVGSFLAFFLYHFSYNFIIDLTNNKLGINYILS